MSRILLFFSLFSLAATAHAQTVYLSPQQALKMAFQGSQTVVLEKKSLTDAQRLAAEKSYGGKVEKKDWNVYLGKTGDRIDGYAIIDNEIGRMEPITFMTAISPQGDIRSVEILVYRESQGSEVHDSRFLKKFEGKSLKHPIRPTVDIPNISGATLSVRAVSLGARRALAIWEALYGESQ